MREVSLDTVLDDFFKYKTSDMYTSLVCRVVTVRSSLNDQRIDVQPLNNRILPDGSSKEHSTILNVPIMFPSSKKASLTFPVDVGDIVLCVFSQRSTDNFKASTGNDTYSAQDRRRFDVRDAIAIPGLFPFKDAINDPSKRKWTHSTRDLVITNNIGSDTECEIRLLENGNIEMKTDQDFYATFNDGLIECNNLTITAIGNVTIDAGINISMTAGANISMTSGASTLMQSTGLTSITAGTDLSLNAATWTVNVTGATNVNAPITNWNGIFNLAGTLTMAGGGGGGTATIDAPLTINNNVTIAGGVDVSGGDVNVTGGDVVADDVHLKEHTHTDSMGGTTSPPIPTP